MLLRLTLGIALGIRPALGLWREAFKIVAEAYLPLLQSHLQLRDGSYNPVLEHEASLACEGLAFDKLSRPRRFSPNDVLGSSRNVVWDKPTSTTRLERATIAAGFGGLQINDLR